MGRRRSSQVTPTSPDLARLRNQFRSKQQTNVKISPRKFIIIAASTASAAVITTVIITAVVLTVASNKFSLRI
jgi:hypothetical protein